MAEWYVYQHDGDPLGPWSTDDVADAILEGKLPPDAWVAAPGGARWLRALDVPVIGRLVDGIPTAPRRTSSGLRAIPSAYVTEAMPAVESTMMMVHDAEVRLTDSELSAMSSSVPTARASSPADETAKIYAFASDADDRPTEPALAPSSSTPSPLAPMRPKDTAEIPSSEERRRKKA